VETSAKKPRRLDGGPTKKCGSKPKRIHAKNIGAPVNSYKKSTKKRIPMGRGRLPYPAKHFAAEPSFGRMDRKKKKNSNNAGTEGGGKEIQKHAVSDGNWNQNEGKNPAAIGTYGNTRGKEKARQN